MDAKLSQWQQQLSGAGYPVPVDAINKLTQTPDAARTNRGFAS